MQLSQLVIFTLLRPDARSFRSCARSSFQPPLLPHPSPSLVLTSFPPAMAPFLPSVVHGGCAKDGSSWWASPSWVSGAALGLALSVLPRTAKLVMLHVISNEKKNLRAEVDATDESDGLQVEIIPFRQDDQPHPAHKRNKHLRLSQPTNQHINHHQSINCIVSLYCWGLALGNPKGAIYQTILFILPFFFLLNCHSP